MMIRWIESQLKWLRESVSGRILAATVMIAGTSGVVKLGSLGKEMLVARYLGASDKLDAFYVAFLLPTYFHRDHRGLVLRCFHPDLY